MDSKEYLTNRHFCPMPWTGLMYNFNGNVKTCIRSSAPIGNIQEKPIEEIVNGVKNTNNRFNMIINEPASRCFPCYDLEQEKNKFDIISDRVFYLRELKQVPLDLYKHPNKFDLRTVDVRWSNLCNFACVYCGPEFSSKWASEVDVKIDTPADQQRQQFKEYILGSTNKLKHVYLAGGEPLLMKENLELLEKLYVENPDVNLRINTNLSKVDTKIFELICKFKNVHWTISVETIEEEYEYVRYGGVWQDFVDNLATIKNLNHKISFNMLHFLLNYRSIFDCIDFLKGMGFHNNSFVAGALLSPEYFDIRHLPNTVLDTVKKELQKRISDRPGFLLENSYQNLELYLNKPMIKNLPVSFNMIKQLDQRRDLDSKNIFKELYHYE
jgi:sulfatase maturation enzyme AslB (radical SAM superfamily)